MKSYLKVTSIAILIVVFLAFGLIGGIKETSSNRANELMYIEPQKPISTASISPKGSKNTYLENDLDLNFRVMRLAGSKNVLPITLEKLTQAKSLSDIIKDYPSSWISNYDSVEISGSIDGREMKAIGPDATLTGEQRSLINLANINSEISIKVNYEKENYGLDIEKRQMNVSMIVIPEMEAEYIGGYDKMINSLRENSIRVLSNREVKLSSQETLISFSVNKYGKTEDVELTMTSGDASFDRLLVELVKKMPNWSPARTINGVTVKQKFILGVGQDDC